MRLVLQRVTRASVSVDGKCVSAINQGLVVLVGIAVGDTSDIVDRLAAKTAALRIFDDSNGVMNLPVTAVNGDVLAVSQFTLLANTVSGNRPSYIAAARPDEARQLYERYCGRLSELLGRQVMTGIFGADMQVELVNDGPVTIIIDSDQWKK